jgi:aspartyl-tRNA(Asn)/glutamyl-tRNA(Gln) amidotransferase subunit A
VNRPDSIRTLQALLRDGQQSSSDLIAASEARIAQGIAAQDAAFISVDSSAARLAASTSDAMRQRRYVPSLLAGLPASVKDLFDVKGQVTTAGSRVLADASPATRDALAVERLRAAGAVFVGRTNMSEFAFSGLGVNPHFGTPLNPLDNSRIVGGSSSGAAASVASGAAVFGLGTDTGGSLRIPAAFTGLTAFKPTARRVPLEGVLPLASSFDSVGSIARSVDCCAIVDSVLASDALDDTIRPLRGLRFGVTNDVVGDELDVSVRDAFDRALDTLQDAGASIERFAFPELREAFALPLAAITAIEAWAWHKAHVARAADKYDPRVLLRLRMGEGRSAADYLDLLEARKRLIQVAWAHVGRFDAWLMPTVAVVAPRLSSLADDAFFVINARVLRNPSVVNFIDGCALTIPCHAPGELPVGLAICGTSMTDASILAIGRSVEAVLSSQT